MPIMIDKNYPYQEAAKKELEYQKFLAITQYAEEILVDYLQGKEAEFVDLLEEKLPEVIGELTPREYLEKVIRNVKIHNPIVKRDYHEDRNIFIKEKDSEESE